MEKKGMINAYVCANLHASVTIHRNDGVTPMFINCPICGMQATSRMGNVNTNFKPVFEWYAPTEAEIKAEATFKALLFKSNAKRLEDKIRFHVEQVGLLMRKIENKPSIITQN